MNIQELISQLDASEREWLADGLTFVEGVFGELELNETDDLRVSFYLKHAHRDIAGSVRAVLALMHLACAQDRDELETLRGILKVLIPRIKLPDEQVLTDLLTFFDSYNAPTRDRLPIASVITAMEKQLHTASLPDAWKQPLLSLQQKLKSPDLKRTQALWSLLERVNNLRDDTILSRFKYDEGWVNLMVADIGAMEATQQRAWDTLLRHAANVTPEPRAKTWEPTYEEVLKPHQQLVREALARGEEEIPELDPERSDEVELGRVCAVSWAEQMRVCIAEVGEQEYLTHLGGWLTELPKSKPGYLSKESLNRECMRGLLWSLLDLADATFVSLLAAAGESLFRKNSQLGRTIVNLLSRISADNTLDELTSLEARVAAHSQKLLIHVARKKVAARRGIAEDDLDETTIPDSGFSELGRRVEVLSDFTAEITINGDKVNLNWYKPNGKPQKSVPALVKREHHQELTDLKRATRQARTTLGTVSERLQQAPMLQRVWNYEDWKQRYFDHPVAGTIARRLIWLFSDGATDQVGVVHEGRVVDVMGIPLAFGENVHVRVWHPIEVEPQQVLALRDWLFSRQMTQPYKQAHREVYLLTDAERKTATYSNRFAGHVLGQSQFRALAKARGWQPGYIRWETDTFSIRELPDWNIRAEFRVDRAGDEVTDSGAAPYVATDQVRFYDTREASEQPLPLDQVPPLVFSEVMRDVDLFVGVASIGTNPAWLDRGAGRQFGDYWHNFSFGELSETARTRADVLARLVPRLTIADRCSIDRRFLVVRGDIRTYRIHLGSGNILMEPNNQYLCIVPAYGAAQRETDGVFLPFEGDQLLSVILSKAFLLADDTQIADPSIVSQIKEGGFAVDERFL